MKQQTVPTRTYIAFSQLIILSFITVIALVYYEKANDD